MGYHLRQISGWRFDDLAITFQRGFCEVLYAAGRTMEAGESLLTVVDKEVDITRPITMWLTGERLC